MLRMLARRCIRSDCGYYTAACICSVPQQHQQQAALSPVHLQQSPAARKEAGGSAAAVKAEAQSFDKACPLTAEDFASSEGPAAALTARVRANCGKQADAWCAALLHRQQNRDSNLLL